MSTVQYALLHDGENRSREYADKSPHIEPEDQQKQSEGAKSSENCCCMDEGVGARIVLLDIRCLRPLSQLPGREAPG